MDYRPHLIQLRKIISLYNISLNDPIDFETAYTINKLLDRLEHRYPRKKHFHGVCPCGQSVLRTKRRKVVTCFGCRRTNIARYYQDYMNRLRNSP